MSRCQEDGKVLKKGGETDIERGVWEGKQNTCGLDMEGKYLRMKGTYRGVSGVGY